MAPLSAVCPAPEAVVSGCDDGSLDPLVCAHCPTMADPDLSCEDAFSVCRMQARGLVCDAQFALCSETLEDAADCLDYADRCFEADGLQGTCLGWFAECYQALTGQAPALGPTCRAYGDACLQEREDSDACRVRFEACAEAD